MTKYYNSRVSPRGFLPNDLVLKKVISATKDLKDGKLEPNWEEPYRVVKVLKSGTYHLETLGGAKLPHPCNVERLKKFFQ